MSLVYLIALLIPFACMVAIDLRWRLFLGRDLVSALVVLAAGLALLLAWDGVGIALGIFFRGAGPFMTGLLLAPELPVEEPIFLLFLCETTMVLILGAARVLAARRSPRQVGGRR